MQDNSVHTWHILSTWVELVATENKSSEWQGRVLEPRTTKLWVQHPKPSAILPPFEVQCFQRQQTHSIILESYEKEKNYLFNWCFPLHLCFASLESLISTYFIFDIKQGVVWMSSSPLSSRKWWINRQTAYWTAGEYSLLFTKSIQLILKKVAYRVEFKPQVFEEVQKAVIVIIDGIFIYLYICFLDLWGNARDISWKSTLLALSGKMLVVFKHSTYRFFLYTEKKIHIEA